MNSTNDTPAHQVNEKPIGIVRKQNEEKYETNIVKPRIFLIIFDDNSTSNDCLEIMKIVNQIDTINYVPVTERRLTNIEDKRFQIVCAVNLSKKAF